MTTAGTVHRALRTIREIHEDVARATYALLRPPVAGVADKAPAQPQPRADAKPTASVG